MNEDVHIVKKGKYIREYFWRIMDFLLKMRLVVLVVDSFDSGVYVKHLFRSFSMIYWGLKILLIIKKLIMDY